MHICTEGHIENGVNATRTVGVDPSAVHDGTGGVPDGGGPPS